MIVQSSKQYSGSKVDWDLFGIDRNTLPLCCKTLRYPDLRVVANVNSSVLPPPPRYPTHQQTMTAAALLGQPIPIVESNNVLNHPAGPEFQLLAGEGERTTYWDSS